MIAIHHYPEHVHNFSHGWLEYCRAHKLQHKIVDCLAPDVIEQLDNVDVLLWHWGQDNIDALHCARQVIRAAEYKGVKVFPDSTSALFYDHKIGQKHLFDALNIPTVPTWIFYDRHTALEWAANQTPPIIAKLNSGSGARNVFMLKTQ